MSKTNWALHKNILSEISKCKRDTFVTVQVLIHAWKIPFSSKNTQQKYSAVSHGDILPSDIRKHKLPDRLVSGHLQWAELNDRKRGVCRTNYLFIYLFTMTTYNIV